MMGQKGFEEKLFYDFSLSKRIPEGHLLKQIDSTVDLSFVREMTVPYYSHTGQPSVDPEVIFKMMLLGYLYGITSERRLAEEVSLNLAFMWYVGYDLDEPTPNHSVISKARARYGRDVFERFFDQVLKMCMEAGLVKGEKLFVDSTLIDANASLKSIVLRHDAVEPKYTAKEFVQRVFEENPAEADKEAEAGEDNTGGTSESQPELSGRRRGRISNKTHMSKTDPDASLIARPKRGLMIAYKDHFTVNESRVITAVTVTPASVEDSVAVSELLNNQSVEPKEFCGDSNYGIPEIYEELRGRGIQAVIPRRSPQARRPKPGRMPNEAFKYDSVKDVFLCPMGRELRRVGYEAGSQRYHYQPRRRECRGCDLKSKCFAERSVRRLFRYGKDRQRAVDWAVNHLKTPEGKKTFSERGIFAEWAIAEAKGLHGLRRAMFRGVDKVTIQALMTAVAQNIKRLIRHKAQNNERLKGLLFGKLVYLLNFYLTFKAIEYAFIGHDNAR